MSNYYESYEILENYLLNCLKKEDMYYEIVEDSYEYHNGIILIIYYDKNHEYEREHICVDVDNFKSYI